MQNKYDFITKLFKKQTETNPRTLLADDVVTALREVENLKRNYNFVSGEMIDYYSYKIKAAELKYNFLLKELKKYDVG